MFYKKNTFVRANNKLNPIKSHISVEFNILFSFSFKLFSSSFRSYRSNACFVGVLLQYFPFQAFKQRDCFYNSLCPSVRKISASLLTKHFPFIMSSSSIFFLSPLFQLSVCLSIYLLFGVCLSVYFSVFLSVRISLSFAVLWTVCPCFIDYDWSGISQ